MVLPAPVLVAVLRVGATLLLGGDRLTHYLHVAAAALFVRAHQPGRYGRKHPGCHRVHLRARPPVLARDPAFVAGREVERRTRLDGLAGAAQRHDGGIQHGHPCDARLAIGPDTGGVAVPGGSSARTCFGGRGVLQRVEAAAVRRRFVERPHVPAVPGLVQGVAIVTGQKTTLRRLGRGITRRDQQVPVRNCQGSCSCTRKTCYELQRPCATVLAQY
jgi:hypothetical protein